MARVSALVRLLCLMLALVMLAGCGRSTVVRRDRDGRPVSTQPISASSVLVRRGDTLYGIAFRAGQDYRDVARWNRISPPYTIYPGQRLQLRGSAAMAPATTRPSATTRPPARVAATRKPVPARTPPPGVSKPAPAPARIPAPRPASVTNIAWRWPTQGALIGRFAAGDNTRQGIDIAGSGGQSVTAAAAGTVVYSGSGLVGYGELIIIKHSDEWLSAYGHNRRRLVAEGAAVVAGQNIAEMGRTGANRDMLHFEIRRNGKPVDPLPLLPAQ
jgi:lipoprotein NlpD